MDFSRCLQTPALECYRNTVNGVLGLVFGSVVVCVFYIVGSSV